MHFVRMTYPGASLSGRSATVPALKWWRRCRAARTKDKKTRVSTSREVRYWQLLARSMHTLGSRSQKTSKERSIPVAPTNGWLELTEVYGSTISHVFTCPSSLTFLVILLRAQNGLPAGKFTLQCSTYFAVTIFRVLSIIICADCLPETRAL